jgi:protein TonB
MSDDDKLGKGFLDELESMSGSTEKKPKKGNSADEVENLLKTTLSEVGIDAERLRASVKAQEAEKKKDREEMDKLDVLLEPIQHPPQDTAHKVLRETSSKPPVETHAAPLRESAHDVLRQTSRGLDRDTVREPARPPLHETQKENKDILFGRTHEKAEIFEKPKPSEKDIFPPMPDKKPAAGRVVPPLQRDRLETAPKKADGALFDSYAAAEAPKKKFPIAAVIVAAVVVIGGASAALLLSKSGKSDVPAETKTMAMNTAAAQPLETVDNPLNQAPAEKPADMKPAPTATPAQKPGANPAKPAANRAPAAEVITQTGQAPENQGVPAEPIQPLVPVQTPRVQDVKLAPQPSAADNAPAAKPAASQTAAPAPKKAKLGDLVPLEQVDVQPAVLQRTEAIYPPLGRRFGIEGTVIVNALVSETGDVIRTTVLRKIQGGGTYGFEQNSEDAVKRWKFKPAVKDGVNVKTWMPVGIVFKK